jgi:hypothetical protein
MFERGAAYPGAAPASVTPLGAITRIRPAVACQEYVISRGAATAEPCSQQIGQPGQNSIATA